MVSLLALVAAIGMICEKAKEGAVELPSDTPVKLMLLKELGSGRSRLEEEVPLVVTEDVKGPSGKVLIPAGSLAVARVVQVRREGALSAPVLDRPARLAIRLERTWSVDKQAVSLKASKDASESDILQLNRDNTQIPEERKEAVRRALEAPDNRGLIEGLVAVLQGKPVDTALLDPAKQKLLDSQAAELGLANCYELIKTRRLEQLGEVAGALQSGSLAQLMAGSNAAAATYLVAMRALKEVASLAGETLGYFGDRFKGRNIHAPIGLTIEAYVARPVWIRAPEEA
ncbi:MAG TPA: hypothetical protein VM328_12265 [Fimbriimonadaceae bacterium]|nr:hypothetical protein [Fimbriimonadaceae bacterium]